jgi:cell division protein FtsB
MSSEFISEFKEQTPKSFDAIFSRLQEAIGSTKDSALAVALGITPQSVYGQKKKGQIPDSWYVKIAEGRGISIKWLKTGEGEKHVGGTTAEELARMADSSVASKFAWTDVGLERIDNMGIKDPGPLRGDETCVPYTPKPAASGHDSLNSPNIADLVAKTIEVLQSGTVFQTALESNIEAFHQAIVLDKKIDQVEERIMSKVSARFESLEEENKQIRAENEQVRTENTQLRQELEQSRAGSALSDTG